MRSAGVSAASFLAALGRMNAHLQRVEGQRVALGYRKLAVDHELPLGQRADHRYDFGEITRKRLAGFRPEIVGETTEAVPFRLKLPIEPGIAINIPGFEELHIKAISSDYTGTLSDKGKLIRGVKKRLRRLGKKVDIYVVTSDTRRTARRELASLVRKGSVTLRDHRSNLCSKHIHCRDNLFGAKYLRLAVVRTIE